LAGLHDGFVRAHEPVQLSAFNRAAVGLPGVYITAQLAFAIGQRPARIGLQGLDLDLPLTHALGIKAGQALQRHWRTAWRVGGRIGGAAG
jgi:hypothetical protein